MNAKGILLEDKNKCFEDKGTGCSFSNEAIKNQILILPEQEFWKLVSIRLNVPLSETNRKELGTEDREYWSRNYLIQEIFLRIAVIREVVTHNNNQVKVYKYYNQALRLAKWIPITKPAIEFVINTSDLTVRILAELKALGPEQSQQVLKLAIAQIFENIVGSIYTHRSILRNLKVRLDK
ncbi:MAG: hypothetical protein WBQ25_22975 [Nitrososphaeraceae archaeon]